MTSNVRRRLFAAIAIALLPASILVAAPAAQAATPNFYKYSWSPDIYDDVNISGTFQKTDPEWWHRHGSPNPVTVNWIPGSELRHYATNTNEVFINGPDRDGFNAHHLTASQFAATGRPASEIYYKDSAFYGYTWNSTIVHHESLSRFYQLDFAVWTQFGQPTPEYRKSYLGDRFCVIASSGAVYFANPTRGINNAIHLTAAQYAGAGSPFLLKC